jgi:37-kD nucleoid-associated bacterial protein
MRDAIDPTVQHAIVHLINHKKQDLVQSDAEVPLSDNGKLRDYFSKQVKNALDDIQTSSARFSGDGDQAASAEVYRILTQPKSFIPSSKTLAKLLFNAMGTDARIKPASLAICVYTASNYPSTNFLALIKIDPTEALIEKVETHDSETLVTFDVLSDVMPTAREKLQKAAIIPPKGTDKTFDLLLLDRQVKAVAADFFAIKFLNTKTALDARDLTVRFYLTGQKIHNRLVSSPPDSKEHIDPQQADVLTQHWDVAAQKETVRFQPLVNGLPLPPEAKTIIRQELRTEFPELKQIKIDPQFAETKLTKKKRFRGDYGVLFEVESEHYNDVVRERTERREPDGNTITRLVIEVPSLQWVK